MIPVLEVFEARFRAHVDAFLARSRSDPAPLDLKRDHSLRVLADARRLIASLGLSPETSRLAEIAALFHDIARFEQFERYGTFHDRKSVDHGRLGQAILKGPLLDGLSENERQVVRLAVLLHNRRSLSGRLDPEVGLLTRIVRDADKLDILPVLLERFESGDSSEGTVTLGLTAHPTAFTPSILAQVRRRELASYEDMVWINDFKLLLASWVYDLNFPWTSQQLRDRGHLDRLLATLPESEDMDGVRRQIRADLAGEAG